MLIEQILEIMPELADVTPWHTVGQRRTLDDVGRTGRMVRARGGVPPRPGSVTGGPTVRLVRRSPAVYDRIRCGSRSRTGVNGLRESAVSSFVGVLGITLVLFFVVAITGRLILGR